MKVKRFNENSNSKKIKEFILDFSDILDNNLKFLGQGTANIIEWIENVAPEYLPEYQNLKSNNFSKLKNLDKFFNKIGEIEEKEKKIIKLKRERLKLLINASSELLYKFQEDLINKNFEIFEDFFIYEDDESEEIEGAEKYPEIHPEILIKYGDKIKMLLDTKKYNL